jgi:putative oxidoreductase
MRVFSILRDGVVSTKDYRRWTQRVSFAVAVIMGVWGATILVSQSVTLWFATSAAVWLALFFGSLLWLFRGSFIAFAAASLTGTVVGRLFSTVQIGATAAGSTMSASDLLLQVETGPGIPGFGYLGLLLGMLLFTQFVLLAVDSVRSSNNERELLIQTWALTFVRLYVGLMFVPHFVGHIFAGPHQFRAWTH